MGVFSTSKGANVKPITVKFGGSSLANAAGFAKVADIVRENPARRYVVVSAPGKANGKDHKITDMLLMCYQLASHRLRFEEVFDIIRARFMEIGQGLKIRLNLKEVLDTVEQEIGAGATRDHCASRGEYISALIMAEYLGMPFVDSGRMISFDSDGRMDESATYAAVAATLKKHEYAVTPGFYGTDASGAVRTFARGGSDITGAVIARGTDSALYENWTDVSGFLMADPAIVDNPMPINSITFRELRELSYMGAQVLQEEAIFPVRERGIPIHIRNTTPRRPRHADRARANGEEGRHFNRHAGRKNFRVISVETACARRVTCASWSACSSPTRCRGYALQHRQHLRHRAAGRHQGKEKKIRVYCSPDTLTSMPSIAGGGEPGHDPLRRRGSPGVRRWGRPASTCG